MKIKRTTAYIILSVLLVGMIVYIIIKTNKNKKEREELVQEHIVKSGIKDPEVIKSMITVPREEFVPGNLKKMAYLVLSLSGPDKIHSGLLRLM